MALIYLIRHGRAAAGFDAHLDPGLDDLGAAQAREAADALKGLGPLPILSSPMRRCRETAAPLEAIWGRGAGIEPRVSEIPSPTDDLAARTDWLRGLMAGTWTEAEAAPGNAHVAPWRQGVIDALIALERDTVVFSHFVAINVAAGAASGDPRVISFRPDNASITTLESNGQRLRLVTLGREGLTAVR